MEKLKMDRPEKRVWRLKAKPTVEGALGPLTAKTGVRFPSGALVKSST